MLARRLLYTCLSTVLLLGIGFIARADVVTSGRFQLSTHVASTAANHTALFVSPSGVDASSDTIVLRYQSGFDLTALSAPNDMDLGVDNDNACDGPFTEKTIASSAAAGTWGVAVSGQDITFTAPTDAAGGEITAGRCVRVRIGTNAVTGATGTHSVVNPGSTGSYEVDVLGTFSDHGMFAVAIASGGAVSVSASVPSSASTPAPSVPTVDTTAPTISAISVLAADTNATITWSTNEPASSQVEYGLTTSYGSLWTDSLFRTDHSVNVSGLTQDTTYHFRILATDASGNSAQSADTTFTTMDVVAPEIQNLTVSNVAATSASLSFTVTDTVDAWVTIGASSTHVWDSSVAASAFTPTITGLTAGTAYVLTVHVVDGGSLEDADTVSFTTLIDLPPGNVSNVAITPEVNQIGLSWENPTDTDLDSIVVRVSTSGYPLTPTSGVGVIDALTKDATHTGLTSNTLYYYTLFARDAAGQYSSGTTISGRTDADIVPEPPVIPPVVDTTPPTTPITPTTPGTPSTPWEPIPGDTSVSPSAPGSDVSGGDGEGVLAAPDTQATNYELSPSLVEFRVANGEIVLPVSPTERVVHVLAHRPIQFVLLPTAWSQTVVSAEVLVGGDSYLVQPSAGFLSPDTTSPLTLTVRFTDGTVRTLAYTMQVVPEHTIARSTATSTEAAGGVATLYSGARTWDALPYAQRNPLIVAKQETVAWYVPVGSYRVRAEGQSGTFAEEQVNAAYAIVAPTLLLSGEETPAASSVPTKIPEALVVPLEKVAQTLDAIREEPAVQAVANISLPIATVAAVSTVSTLATSFSLLSYLRYLFSAPLLLFGRRKRKQWGTVYDSLRKVPVDLAIVRLLDARTGKVVKSQVTDKQGRYFFQATPGLYKLTVQKSLFAFPSAFVAESTDGDWLDVYHGEQIEVRAAGITIALNIPLDSTKPDTTHEPAFVLRRRWLRRVQHVVAVSGVVLAAVVVVLQPTVFSWSMLAVQVGTLALFARLARAPKPKGWGMVFDTVTKKPITKAIVRIFEPKFNKLLDTQITDAQGRYAFLVGPNQYYATYQHVSHEPKELNPIDRRGAKEPGFVSESVGLAPKHT